jgi:hypothetical protein
MIEYKQNVAARVNVRIFDTLGNPVAGVVFGAVTVAVQKSDGSTAIVTATALNWSETVVGAFSGQGVYQLILPSSALDITGQLTYAVASIGNKTHVGAVKVVANEEVDTFAIATLLQKIETGRWKVDTTTNQITFYDPVTPFAPILVFNLKDSTGAPTPGINVFERVP